jgi:hypothetical protein
MKTSTSRRLNDLGRHIHGANAAGVVKSNSGYRAASVVPLLASGRPSAAGHPINFIARCRERRSIRMSLSICLAVLVTAVALATPSLTAGPGWRQVEKTLGKGGSSQPGGAASM